MSVVVSHVFGQPLVCECFLFKCMLLWHAVVVSTDVDEAGINDTKPTSQVFSRAVRVGRV